MMYGILNGQESLVGRMTISGRGEPGVGIETIVQTETSTASGGRNTWTVTLTDGRTSSFYVRNGAKGDTGVSITNVALKSSSGLVDTYEITFSDGNTTTFNVTNGNGISSIAKTGTSGNVDTYTISYTNGTTSTFTVTNSNVSSVNGQTGDVVLTANEITYDETAAQTSGSIGNEVTNLKTAMSAANKRLDAIEEAEGLHRYGVSGIGQSASALTRIWDAVGMTAQVGTDGDNSSVVNNFDDVTPFNRRKCVGKWHIVDGRAQFSVAAYLGDENYTEDGSIGDYVAVECPRAYYYNHNGIWAVSAHNYEGWEPFDIFCHNHNHDETFEYCYLPAYQLAVKDGHAVSLPGLDNEQGDYASLLNAARTYDGDGVEVLAMLQPSAVYFYEQMLYTIEFARQVPTAVLKGCISLRSNDADTLHFIDATHAVSNNYFVARVEGEFIAVTESAGHASVTYKASHKIVSIERCDENGTPDASGTHQLMELEDLGKAYFTYEIGTEYNFAPRPWRTGSCNGVSTPSGSPVSNTSGYYPMKYRWRENIWGNQYHTSADLFNKRILNENQEYCLEWYLLKDPTVLTPAKNIGSADLEDTELFYKLSVDTPHDKYVNGYIKSRQYDEEYHDIWIPDAVTGASASTYYAVSAALVSSTPVRSVRFGAPWYSGLVSLSATLAPSSATASSGGDLCFAQ